jgi:predicted dehydrogenase
VKVRGAEEQVFEAEQIDTFAAEISHFVDCLTTGARPLNTHEEGISVLGIILAAYESSRTGQVADVLSV